MSATIHYLPTRSGPASEGTLRTLHRAVDDYAVEWCLPAAWEDAAGAGADGSRCPWGDKGHLLDLSAAQ
jgi:hypothetical protein